MALKVTIYKWNAWLWLDSAAFGGFLHLYFCWLGETGEISLIFILIFMSLTESFDCSCIAYYIQYVYMWFAENFSLPVIQKLFPCLIFPVSRECQTSGRSQDFQDAVLHLFCACGLLVLRVKAVLFSGWELMCERNQKVQRLPACLIFILACSGSCWSSHSRDF